MIYWTIGIHPCFNEPFDEVIEALHVECPFYNLDIKYSVKRKSRKHRETVND